MWNFSFIYPTLLILFILLVFYFSLPRLGIRQNKVFLKIIIIETLVVISDIVSSIMDNNYQDHPLALVSVEALAGSLKMYDKGKRWYLG